jgi:hypothetical protein
VGVAFLLIKELTLKIFYAFLIVMTGVILFLLPVTDAVYSFRTDVKLDEFRIETDGATTTANVTLLKSVFDNDTSTISITSDAYVDAPVFIAYDSTTRKTDIAGLLISTNRTLTVAYDYDALSASTALSNFIDKVGWVWLIVLVIFPVAAIAALFLNKEN